MTFGSQNDERGDRGETARPREEMNATTLLVDLRASAREGAKPLAKEAVSLVAEGSHDAPGESA